MNTRKFRGRVLVVDDDYDARNILEQFFSAYGYDARVARDGLEALAILRSGLEFNAVILDLLMPTMSGYQLLRAIKEQPLPLSAIPVIVTSAASKLFFGKAIAVFPKPTPLMELLKVVDGLSGPDGAAPPNPGRMGA